MRIGFEFFINRILRLDAHLNCDTGSAAGSAVDYQIAAHRLRTLPHVEESEMPAGRLLADGEALAVIPHGQAGGVRRVPQLDRDVLSAAVVDGIGHGLLP